MTFKEKAKKFWQEHKTGIIIGTVTTGLVIIGCIISAKREDDHDLDYDFFEDSRLPNPPKSTCTVDSVFTNDLCTKNWNEELYRENWDKVNEFAKTLRLQTGETYILDDSQRFYFEPWYYGEKDGHVIVSHVVDSEGCYPPGNKEEEAA